ncbi:orotate phosphoribosyltransferase [Georgenia sp. Z1491]|uniref:orotate phosphoribosyltransferase n=1 Tax=Georgenia sp. Z1491 TaxID=3416707 RepID=UPI003CF1A96A
MTSTPAPASNDPQRARLAAFVGELGVVRGRVVLSSGKESDYYVDMRRVTLHQEAGPLLGHVLLDLLEEEGLGAGEIDAVGGLTLGADPVATAIMHAASSRGQGVDAFVVRKEAKAHGMQRRIEGPDIAGRRVVVVEDTSTTGGSALTAAHAVAEAGAEIAAVLVVLDRATGAREAVEEAGHRYLNALELADVGLA